MPIACLFIDSTQDLTPENCRFAVKIYPTVATSTRYFYYSSRCETSLSSSDKVSSAASREGEAPKDENI